MRWLLFLIFIFIITLLTACSNPEPKDVKEIRTEVATVEAVEITREAVFTYGNNQGLQKRISLRFASEPVPINEGYIRLVGIISGKNPIACIEISGKGCLVTVGEEIDQYIVNSIKKKEVVLCLKN